MGDLPQPFRRRSDGLWACKWRDDAGKWRWAYGPTARAAEDNRATKMRRHSPDQTVGEYLAWWADVWLARQLRNGRLAPSTVVGYRQKVRLHLIPKLGGLPLAKLGAQHVDDALDEIAATPSRRRPVTPRGSAPTLSDRTVQYCHATLRAALNTAIRYELVDRNVAEHVTAPSVARSKVTPFTPAQARAFIAACRGDRLEALWLVALAVGLRISEALAIDHDAIDLDAGTLDVSRHLQRHDGRWLIGDTKTHAGATMQLPGWALHALRRRLEVQQLERIDAGPIWQPAPLYQVRTGKRVDVDLVFTRRDGQPMWDTTVTKALTRLCGNHGLPRLTPHKLRHSCASLLIAQGASLAEVQHLLRHANQQMTSDVYVHLYPEVQAAHATRMDDLVAGDGDRP